MYIFAVILLNSFYVMYSMVSISLRYGYLIGTLALKVSQILNHITFYDIFILSLQLTALKQKSSFFSLKTASYFMIWHNVSLLYHVSTWLYCTLWVVLPQRRKLSFFNREGGRLFVMHGWLSFWYPLWSPFASGEKSGCPFAYRKSILTHLPMKNKCCPPLTTPKKVWSHTHKQAAPSP